MAKLNSLQILRALAAISVLIAHVFQNLNYKPFGDYFISGQYGVDIFFILSGFLIFLTTKEYTNTKIYVKKRLFRIYPLYLVALLTYITAYFFMEGAIALSLKSVIQNVLMFPWDEAIGYKSLIVVVAWSTVFEMFFYFLFFLILLFKKSREKIFYIIPILFILSKVILKFELLPDKTPFLSLFLSLGGSRNLFMFLVGCIICQAFIDGKIPRISKSKYKILLTIIVFSFCLLQLIRYNFYLSFLCCSFLFIAFCEFDKYFILNEESIVVKILIFIGDISYSIYLFHIIIIKMLLHFFNFNNVFLLLISTLFFTILVSIFTYKKIEKPFISFAKK